MLPGGHPDAPSRRRWPRLRRRAPLSHRHYDALTERLDRIDKRREQDFSDLWSYLADIADRPDSVVLREILAEVREMRGEATDRGERLAKFIDVFSDSARSASDAAGQYLQADD